MAANPISKSSVAWLGPASDCVAITAHDTDEITPTRGFMVNGAGNVAVRFTDSSADVTLTLLAGTYYPYSIKAVRATSTTATGIHGFY
jgi:hypothetical protein